MGAALCLFVFFFPVPCLRSTMGGHTPPALFLFFFFFGEKDRQSGTAFFRPSEQKDAPPPLIPPLFFFLFHFHPAGARAMDRLSRHRGETISFFFFPFPPRRAPLLVLSKRCCLLFPLLFSSRDRSRGRVERSEARRLACTLPLLFLPFPFLVYVSRPVPPKRAVFK